MPAPFLLHAVGGSPDTGAAHPPDVLEHLLAAARRHDPDGIFAFQRVAHQNT